MMKLRKALAFGTVGTLAALPLALQLVAPTAASAMQWGPVISKVSPISGPASGGTQVVITGQDLTIVTGIEFGGVPASYTIVSSTEIIATSPAEADGTVPLQVGDGPRILVPTEFTYS